MQQIEGQWLFPMQGGAILPGDVRKTSRQRWPSAIANLCQALTECRLRQICPVCTVENRNEARLGRFSCGPSNQRVEPTGAGIGSGARRAPQSDRDADRYGGLQGSVGVWVSVDDDGA